MTRSRRGRRATSCSWAARRRRARAGPDAAACAPLRFLRELACVDANLAPAEHSRVPWLPAAARRRLRPSSLLALRPRPRPRTPIPTTRRWPTPGASRACSARLRRPRPARRRACRCTRPSTRYETNPPDPTAPYGTDGAGRASSAGRPTWRGAIPARRMFAQFLLRDIGPRDPRRRPGTRWSDFQTGLFFSDGTPKPAAQAFRMPVLGAGPGRRRPAVGAALRRRAPRARAGRLAGRAPRRGGRRLASDRRDGRALRQQRPGLHRRPLGMVPASGAVHGPRGVPPEPPAPERVMGVGDRAPGGGRKRAAVATTVTGLPNDGHRESVGRARRVSRSLSTS